MQLSYPNFISASATTNDAVRKAATWLRGYLDVDGDLIPQIEQHFNCTSVYKSNEAPYPPVFKGLSFNNPDEATLFLLKWS